MIFSEDEYYYHEENQLLELSVFSVVGDREEQQDCAGAVLNDRDAVVLVCDGMGGQADGKKASNTACGIFLSGFEAESPSGDLHTFLLDTAAEADNSVCELGGKEGDSRAGSTVAAVCVREGKLFWLSVGDSRIYIYRHGELVRATADHNYKYLLDAQLESGMIDRAEYNEKIKRGEALVSFLGVGGIPFIEANNLPFVLSSGDRILITSDGLYKLVSDEGIRSAIRDNPDVRDVINALEQKAQRSAENINRDNMTVALIKIK